MLRRYKRSVEGGFSYLESHTWDITYGMTRSTETCDEHLILQDEEAQGHRDDNRHEEWAEVNSWLKTIYCTQEEEEKEKDETVHGLQQTDAFYGHGRRSIVLMRMARTL